MVRSDISVLSSPSHSVTFRFSGIAGSDLDLDRSICQRSVSPLSLGWISNDVNYFTETGSSIALQNPRGGRNTMGWIKLANSGFVNDQRLHTGSKAPFCKN